MKNFILYDANPLVFKDDKADGIGDLKGFTKKAGYFKFLGVSAVVIPNFLYAFSKNQDESISSILDRRVGTLNEFKNLAINLKNMGIPIIIDMKLSYIKENYKWYQSALDSMEEESDEKSDEDIENTSENADQTRSFYIVNDSEKFIDLDYSNLQTQERMREIFDFFTEFNVIGVRISHFSEFIEDNLLDEKVISEIREFYKMIKRFNSETIVLGQMDENISNIEDLVFEPNKALDYIHFTNISMLGTHPKYVNDKIGKFEIKDLVSEINKTLKYSSNILALGSNRTGRICSRWGNSEDFHDYLAKAIATIHFMCPNSKIIHQGDEIGALNIGLGHNDDFLDHNLNQRQKDYELKKEITHDEFFAAQSLQARINSYSLMPWNSSKNGGFSPSNSTIVPVSHDYKENNIKIQYQDPNSILNFYKGLIHINRKGKYSQLINEGAFKIKILKFSKSLIKITREIDDMVLTVFINFSDKPIKHNLSKIKGKLLFSNYLESSEDLIKRNTLSEYQVMAFINK